MVQKVYVVYWLPKNQSIPEVEVFSDPMEAVVHAGKVVYGFEGFPRTQLQDCTWTLLEDGFTTVIDQNDLSPDLAGTRVHVETKEVE